MAVLVATASTAKPLDIGAMVKEAGLTALVMLALTVVLVGFEIRDVPGGLEIHTRFADVAIVTLLAFVGRIALVLLREHRHRAVLLVGVPFTLLVLVLLLSEAIFGLFGLDATGADLKRFLPFKSPVVMWVVAIVSLIFTMRAGLGLWRAETGISLEDREKAMDRFSARVQRVAVFLGPILLTFAIALPFLPFVDRRILDIGILVVTYIMLGWGLNVVVGLAGLLDLGYVAFYAVGAYSYALLATHFDLSFWVCLPS